MRKFNLPSLGGLDLWSRSTENLKRCCGLLLLFALSFQLNAQTCGLSLDQENVTCAGDSDGTLLIEITNEGTGPWTATWTGFMGAPLDPAVLAQLPTTLTAATTGPITGLPEGQYWLTVMGGNCDNNGGGLAFASAQIGANPDNTPPTIVCPLDIITPTDLGVCEAVVNWADPVTNDNCDISSVVCTHVSGSVFPIGTTTVTCTVTDISNNMTSCSFDVTVLDQEDPVLDCSAINPVRPANAGLCSFTMPGIGFNPVATDNCGAILVNDLNGTATLMGENFPVGITPVVWTLTDAAGNSVSCAVDYEITDTQNPTIACPANIAVSTDAGSCDAVVTWAAPVANDNCPGEVVTSTHNPGDVFPLGSTTVIYTVTDAAGNSANCSFTVTVTDNENPVIACPANINTAGDLTLCGAVVTWAAPVASDNCPGEVVTSTHNSGDTFSVGTTTVTYTVTDAAGNTAICSFDVTVEDTEAPTIICPLDINLSSTEASCGSAAMWATPVTDDNCGVSTVISTHNSGDFFPVGTTTVTYTVEDLFGNTASCSFDIIVTDDTNPTLVCPTDIAATTDAGVCEAVVTFADPTIFDDCGTVTVVCNPPSGSTFPLGTTPVTCTATDAAGNTATCTFDVTVTDDENPTIVCPADITAMSTAGTCETVVTWVDPVIGTDALDNCGVVTVVCNPPSGSTFPVGITPVTCTATDAAGNTATCTFDVIVTDDTPPAITCPADIMTNMDAGDCSAVVTWTDPVATDDCGGATVVCNPPSGSTFPIGTTTVTCTATDAAGNIATCTFDVTVEDTEAPTIICPLDITVASEPNICGAMVTWNAPTIDDNCAVDNINVSHLPGNVFPVGTTTVTYTVTDPSGNDATCSFNVTVTDDGEPTIVCPNDITTDTDAGMCGAVVAWTDPVVADDCGIQSVVCNPPSGSTFALGTTTVTCTATDNNGNSFSCTFDVTVEDSENPTIVCPADIVESADPGACETVVTWIDPVIGTDALDNCGVVTVVCNPPSGSTFPVGTTPVTCTATDAAGNTAVCSFDVTVTDDEDPAITCPANITLFGSGANCSAVGTWTDPVATDNCGIASVVCDPPSGSVFTGTTMVTCTATDINGNTSVCTFMVTVEDGSDPVITCPTDISVGTDPGVCSAVVTWTDPVATDDCGTVTTVCNPPSGSTFPIGTTTVTCTTTDGVGNTATCTFDVTVADDENPIIFLCQSTQTIPTTSNGAGDCTGEVPDLLSMFPTQYSAMDNCGATFTQVPAPGTTFGNANGDTQIVVMTAEDAAGNSVSCNVTLTLEDNEDPTITCPENVVVSSSLNSCDGVAVWPEPVAADNCNTTVTSTHNSGDVFPAGVTVVTYTVTDDAGNSVSCSFTVTVEGVSGEIACPEDVVVDSDPWICQGMATFPDPTFTACPGADVSIMQITGLTSGSMFNVGTTVVGYALVDNNSGAFVDFCYFSVTVNDTEAPLIVNCPEDITVDVPECETELEVFIPIPQILIDYKDNCGNASIANSINGTNDASGIYQVGTTSVIWTVTDAAGNTTTCEQLVTVNGPGGNVTVCEDVELISDQDLFVDDGGFASNGTISFVDATSAVGSVTSNGTLEMYFRTVGPSCEGDIDVQLTAPDGTVMAYPAVIAGCNAGGALYFISVPVGGATITSSPATWTLAFDDSNGQNAGDEYSFRFGRLSYTSCLTTGVALMPELINCPADMMATVAGNGVCTAPVSVPVPVFGVDYDDCIGATMTNDYNGTADGSDDYPIGTTVVTWTVTNTSGVSVTCEQTITVSDVGPTIISCPADINQETDSGACEATVVVPPLQATDCGTFTVTNDYNNTTDASGTYPIGTTTVNWTVTDNDGNVATCSTDITITEGSTVLTVKDTIQIVSDQDDLVDVGGFAANPEMTFADPGTATGTITDINLRLFFKTKNAACEEDIAVQLFDATGVLLQTWPASTVFTGCMGTSGGANGQGFSNFVYIVDLPINTPAAATIAAGDWVVQFDDANDDNAGDAEYSFRAGVLTYCAETTTVVSGGAPVITSCPGDMTIDAPVGTCEAAVTVPALEATDCGTFTVTNDYNNTADASDTYPAGTTTVVWTVTDNDGLTSTCSTDITVNANGLMITNCPAAITVTADQAGCTADVTVPALEATGCGAVTITNDVTNTADASGNYPLGTTTVTWTVTDADGNMATCSTDITVTASALAITTCPADMTVTAAAGACDAMVTVPALEATGCGNLAITNDYNNTADASATYPIGVTTVTWTVTDATGAVATCSTDITVEAEATTTTVMDTVIIVSDQDGFVDDAGFASSLMMTYVDPGTAPGTTLSDMNLRLWFRLEGNSCESDIEVQLYDPTGTLVQEWLTGEVFGTCNGGNSLYIIDLPVTGAAATTGAADDWVVLFNDAAGQNAGDEYSFRAGVLTYVSSTTVTVGGGAPIITSCPADATGTTTAGTCAGDVVVDPLMASDCGTITITNDYNNTADASDTYPLGTTTVTWTVVDDEGNMATCTTEVTVTDGDAPMLTCPAEVTATGDPVTCEAELTIPALVDGTNYTDCSAVVISNDYTGTDDASGSYPVGTTAVVWTVTDAAGNTATCEQMVTVDAPVVSVEETIVSDQDGFVDDAGFASSLMMTYADPGTDPGATLSNMNLRLWFRLAGNSCESDIEVQLYDPTGTLVQEWLTGEVFATCNGGNGLYIVDLPVSGAAATTGAADDWVVLFNDAAGQNAGDEYSFRAGVLTYTASMLGCGANGLVIEGGNDVPTGDDTQSTETEMLVYPVPTMSNLTLEFPVSANDRANITVINSSGNVVLNRDEEVFQGINKVLMDVTPLAPGTYYVRVQTTNDLHVKPFVKINP